MKKVITKLEDVLALKLQDLYAGEIHIKEKVVELIPYADCARLQEILKKYTDSSDHKRLKLERMFSYLMLEPVIPDHSIIERLLAESVQKSKHVQDTKVKTLLLISDFQQINHFKITAYKTALLYALELELDPVADLLHQIVEWERKTEKVLAELCLQEFSKVGETQQGACNK